MSQKIIAEPSNHMSPGTVVTDDGIEISAVFRGSDPCGVILYHIPDGRRVRVPFSDEHRFGSLYCAKISPLDPSEWGYRLYTGDTEFIDPASRSILFLGAGSVRDENGACGTAAVKTERVGGFFYERDDRLPPYRMKAQTDQSDEIIYCFHVRGFTMLAEGITSKPGTFSAAAEKISYLKDLGVSAVEIMPVYEQQPVTRPDNGPRTMEDALALYPVNHHGRPIRDLSVPKCNYWGYTRGFYYAPNSAYSTPGYPGGAQKEFADMIERFHKAGIKVYLQLYFPASVTSQAQSDIARFYVTHYNADGFRLMGSVADICSFSSDPLLTDTRLFFTNFPYDQICAMDEENPESGMISTANLSDYNGVFASLLRRFAKSDDYTMRAFLHEFVSTPIGHGNVHYICSSDGFTLRDLVSYNEKHNEANGEGGIDGPADNYSWNCGEEGDSSREDVLRLRRSQIRNMLTLLFLSRGTPMIHAGDENFNTQEGNNNPYCQDNEIGWTGWDNGETGLHIHDFVKRIIRFRKEHAIFTTCRPLKSTDHLGIGYPDISLHGREAWKPDLSFFSHSIGLCLCENYVRPCEKTELIYIAMNMHWEKQELGLPKLAPGRRWNLLIDTALETPFMDAECIPDDQHIVEVEPRSIKILGTVTSNKPMRRRRTPAKAARTKADGETGQKAPDEGPRKSTEEPAQPKEKAKEKTAEERTHEKE